MKHIPSALVALLLAAALLVLMPISKHPAFAAHAQGACGEASLTGTYGFAFSGFVVQQNVSQPFYGSGIATFHNGNVSASFAASVNGAPSPDNTYTGTYTVNHDCTVSVTSTSQGDNFVGVIVDGGAEVLATDITPGDTLNVDFKKLEKTQ
jgi:hypothetical protein